jgi:hypothetical protein
MVSRRSASPFVLVFLRRFSRAGALGCDPPLTMREATPEEIQAFFKSKKMKVVTFLGYSGAGYENEAAMLEHATRILSQFDPKTTIVNSGATAEGIGALYQIAKQKGFITAGIVSTQAREDKVSLSPFVDILFFVKDATWGGFLPGTHKLSPTSKAMVENSDVLVAIGGGEVACDELAAARRSGKRVEFIPADMNHEIAREKALKKGQAPPIDFRGAAAELF